MSRLRSPIKRVGGKGRLLRYLLPLIPDGGRPYCEPYCGGASVFFARPPAPVEVLNDLDGDVINLFRCLQDEEKAARLIRLLEATPFARAEFVRALDVLLRENAGDVDRAWAFIVSSRQGFAGRGNYSGDWGRSRFTSKDVRAWWASIFGLRDVCRRLAEAQIESRDALVVIRQFDNPAAVFYVDPPYVLSARKRKEYKHEADDAHHRALVYTLLACKGAVVLSGYPNDIYSPLEAAGWKRTEFKTSCHVAGRVRGSKLIGNGAARAHVPRTEVVWQNPRCLEMLAAQHGARGLWNE